MNKIEVTEELLRCTKQFALRIIKLYQALPKSGECQVLGKQILRCRTSVASNYRAACRVRSRAEFFSKLSIVVEEADETVFWIDLLIEANIMTEKKLAPLLKESVELLSIFSKPEKQPAN